MGKPKKSFHLRDIKPQRKPAAEAHTEEWPMRLNKYVAHCGICSRREAAELVKAGKILFNGKVTLEPFILVEEKDEVRYEGKLIKPETRRVYLLLNKPKDTITTVQDDRGRRTVLDLIRRPVKERIYPVGRLDRLTTGLLLLTNDGELAQKLSHPSSKIAKVYHVTLDRTIQEQDLEKIRRGVSLEDGTAEIDAVNYVEGASRREVAVELHSGKNRIVRRIFEHLEYNVVRLDRVYYAGLTKKDLPRGHYRELTQREIIMLRHFTR